MLGIELNSEHLEVPESQTTAIHICNKLIENGLLVPPAGTETIRFLPPLNITEAETSEALSILKNTLDRS